MKKRIALAFALLATLGATLHFLAACDREAAPPAPKYIGAPALDARIYSLAVHPLHNPEKLVRAYQPLIDHLNRQIVDARFSLEASRDYAEYERKFRARTPDLLLPNPWHTIEAMKVGYGVIAMAGEPGDFKGIFVVRRDGDIRKPADLKGKAVAYPSPTALAAGIMPQWFLHQRGVNVNRDIENRYVGSQESAIMNAYLGQVAAGATWPPPWRLFQKDHPREAAQLKVAWETPPLINNSFMVRDDLPPKLRARLRAELLKLHDSEPGRRILAGMETARFLPAADANYAVVREFVARFEAQVRPVEKK